MANCGYLGCEVIVPGIFVALGYVTLWLYGWLIVIALFCMAFQRRIAWALPAVGVAWVMQWWIGDASLSGVLYWSLMAAMFALGICLLAQAALYARGRYRLGWLAAAVTIGFLPVHVVFGMAS